MLNRPAKQISARIESLRAHLDNENPLLVQAIRSFQNLDNLAYRMELLSHEESFASRIAWWPMISVLGTYSAGKSTFINQYAGIRLQATGNQAVDDKFTVICYSKDDSVRVLPGLSLDADPRFPFYQINEEIEKVAKGEGGRVDTYLQLKTCPSEVLRGKILIDSPGFDADQQRDSTLRITDHIIDLSDLVLVFFDARHPEAGTMQDTLEHLVTGTIRRNDANKILFILNQIDETAREDNAEDVIAAWQRALAQCGLTSGRFYAIYNENASVPIEDENLRDRYQAKRDADLAELYQRMSQVGVERVYRIIGALEHTANQIEHRVVPKLRESMIRWKKNVIRLDLIILVPILVGLLALSLYAGYWQRFTFSPPWLEFLGPRPVGITVLLVVLVAGILAVHFWVRKIVARRIAKRLRRDEVVGDVARAFIGNTRWWRSLLLQKIKGWGRISARRLEKIREDADRFVQELNDRYTDPSGEIKVSGADATGAETKLVKEPASAGS